jgi:dipeptidyl aminopeptidase/acylaminoacyl peptidase
MIQVIILVLLLFLVTVCCAVVTIGPYIILRPARRNEQWYAQYTTMLKPTDIGLSYEDVVVTTDDNVRITAWFIPSSNPRGTIIYLHGIADSKISGIGIARLFVSRGYNVLLPDLRKHGMSEGKFCTHGYYEKYDVRKAVDYLISRKDILTGKIGLMGTSMGAAIALQAAAIDDRIACVVAEASYTHLRTIALDYQHRIIGMRLKWLNNIVLGRAEKIANFRVDDVSPANAIAQLRIPVLLVHGKLDPLIKHGYSEELRRESEGRAELYELDDASHNDIQSVGGKDYEDKIVEFFERSLRR